jgi:hypothetical protein
MVAEANVNIFAKIGYLPTYAHRQKYFFFILMTYQKGFKMYSFHIQ